MENRPKATIDSIINKDFRYRFRNYQKGEIFERNPNKRSHNSLVRTNRISDFDESKYEYVCCKYNAVIGGKPYKLLDVIPQDLIQPGMSDILVKRKAISKRLKGFAQKQKELIQETTFVRAEPELEQLWDDVEELFEPKQEVEDYTDFNVPTEMTLIDFLMSLKNQQVAKDVLKIDVNSLREIVRNGGAEDHTTPSGFTYKAQMKRSHAEIVKDHIDSLKAKTDKQEG